MKNVLKIIFLMSFVFVGKEAIAKSINLENFPQSTKLGALTEKLEEPNNLVQTSNYIILNQKQSSLAEAVFIALNPEKIFYLPLQKLNLQWMGKYSSISFFTKSEVVIFNGEENKKHFFVINGRKTRSFDQIPIQQIASSRLTEWMSPNEKKLFYFACDYSGKTNVDKIFSQPNCSAVVSDAVKDVVIPLKRLFEHPQFKDTPDDRSGFSPDSEHFFFISNGSLVWDGQLKKPVHWVKGPFFNAQGNKGLYIGEWHGKEVVMLNGEQVSGEYEKVFCDETRAFNTQGDWVCIVEKDKKFFVLKNGKEMESFEADTIRAPIFSPIDGKLIYAFVINHNLYLVTEGEKKQIYSNEKAEKIFAQELWFDKKSGEILVVIREKEKEKLQEFFVFQNKMSPKYSNIKIDSHHNRPKVFEEFYYKAFVHKGQKTSLEKVFFVYDKTYGPYDHLGDIVFSPDHQHWAIEVWEDFKNQSYLVNGKEGEKFTRLYSVQFSQDGESYLYMAEKGGKKEIRELYHVLNGKKTLFRNVESEHFPEAYFYPYSNEKIFFWLRGKQYEKCPADMGVGGRLCYYDFSALRFNDDRETKGYIPLNQGFQFSSDGKKIGFLVINHENELWWQVENLE